MKFYGEMRVQGGGPLDGSRFDALAYALAEIEATDPAIEDVDLTSSLAQGWVTASMTISHENLELAVAKLIATVRTAIYPNGDHAGGWQFLTREQCFPYVSRVARARAEETLTPATIETLAIVAYKQPVTRAEVDAIRGASSGHLLRILIDRGKRVLASPLIAVCSVTSRARPATRSCALPLGTVLRGVRHGLYPRLRLHVRIP